MLVDVKDGNFLDKQTKERIRDYEIWQQFRQGKESAFIHIYDLYFDLLYHYSQQFSKDKSLIKDCIQDLFLDIRRNRQSIQTWQGIWH